MTAELGSTALFGSRFREAAARSLLIPRRRPDRRMPLWQQRLRAQGLLQIARRYGEFPVILETYREVLSDWLDLPALKRLLDRLERREVSLVEVDTPNASPFAQSLLFDYIATYMYEGDVPRAEQRAAALALDRDLLRELLGSEELRELIDPEALAAVEEDLQHLSAKRLPGTPTRPTTSCAGSATSPTRSCRRASCPGIDAQSLAMRLVTDRRAVKLRVGGEDRWIAAQDAGLYRDAVGAVPPGGLPEAFLEPVEDALAGCCAATRAPTAPSRRPRSPLATSWRRTGGCRALRARGAEELVRGEIRPAAPAPGARWCDPDVLRRLRRASIAALRQEIEPTDQATLQRFALWWHGIDRYRRGSGRAAIEQARSTGERRMPLRCRRRTACASCSRRSRESRCRARCGSATCCRGAWAATTRRGSTRSAPRARSCGPAPAAAAAAAAGSRSTSARTRPTLARRVRRAGPRRPGHEALRERLGHGAAFWSDLVADVDGRRATCARRCGTWCGRAR